MGVAGGRTKERRIMTATTFADDLVREYLLFRGFIATLKAFEVELKSDKDKGFRADKIVDQLCSSISSYDLGSLREAWAHLDQRIFSRLEHSFMPTVRKLENSLLKMYVVNTLQTNRHDKLVEFFERCSQDLQNQSEWKEWFVLPFIKNPEENQAFAVYFTRQWQDTMLVSLHNFLSIIFQCMALPTLMSYEEEQAKISQLQDENDMLKQQVAALQARERPDQPRFPEAADYDIPLSSELMDDFYVIAQETPTSDSQLKTIRSLIKNISSGLPTSPILGRRQSTPVTQSTKKLGTTEEGGKHHKTKTRTVSTSGSYTASGSSSSHKSKSESEMVKRVTYGVTNKEENIRLNPAPEQLVLSTTKEVSSRLEEAEMSSEKTRKEDKDSAKRQEESSDKKPPLLLLSQEEYAEHQSAITHCKFNASGLQIASSDLDGVIKIWSASPSPRTLSTVISKSPVLSLEWAQKRERLLLHGNKTGIVRLYDTKEKKTLCEIGTEANSPLKEQRVLCLACSPTESCFVSSSAGRPRSSITSADLQPTGRLLLWDLKNMKLDKQLSLGSTQSVINCCVFNHNGQLLVAGTADGRIHLFDMHRCECITQWQAHRGETYSVQFSADETSCYSMGSDGKFLQWSINKTGQKLNDFSLHDRCAGPFLINASQTPLRSSIFHPMGKLFAFDTEGKNLLTCAGSSGLIYNLASGPNQVLRLGGHKANVVTMDWATTVDCGTCLTASLDGKIRVSTILAQ